MTKSGPAQPSRKRSSLARPNQAGPSRKWPSLALLDLIRQEFFRPTVVACLIHRQKVLLVYQKKHRAWLLPQGGIDNRETVARALIREVGEEIGEKFARQIRQAVPVVIGEDRLRFGRREKARELFSDRGEAISMVGKHYFFGVVQISRPDFDLESSEFDRAVWADYAQASQIIGQIYFKNKKVVLQKAIDLLKAGGLIE